MGKNNHLLKAENIRFQVAGRKRKILDIPGIWLDAGKINFVLGANGAGKSSLLHFLAGRLHLPDARLFIHGQALPPLSDKLMPGYRGIELIRQEPDLNPHFRVGEELDRHLRKYDHNTSVRKKQLYIKQFNLKGILEQKTGSISGGERRRLALACALAGSPQLILLDEPFSDLDAQGRNLLSSLILEMASQGIAFLIVSHFGEDAHWLADEVWTLDAGRIIERLHFQDNGFAPGRYKTASLLGMKNIFPAALFPGLNVKEWKQLAFPENALQPYDNGMLLIGDSQCIRSRNENGSQRLMWKTPAGLIFTGDAVFGYLEPGSTVNLGIRHEDIFFLK